jgi:hypothetical protein
VNHKKEIDIRNQWICCNNFWRILQKAFSAENIVTAIVNKKSEEIGIVLSAQQLEKLQDEIKKQVKS